MVKADVGAVVSVTYWEGDIKRFIKSARVIDQGDKFLTLDLDKYRLQIAISQIIKIEQRKQVRPGRNPFDY